MYPAPPVTRMFIFLFSKLESPIPHPMSLVEYTTNAEPFFDGPVWRDLINETAVLRYPITSATITGGQRKSENRSPESDGRTVK